jgi:hypothetical protein
MGVLGAAAFAAACGANDGTTSGEVAPGVALSASDARDHVQAGTPPASRATGRVDISKDGGSDAGTFWTPSSKEPVHFHWQLSDVFKYPADVIPGDGAIVYDIDGQTNDAATVASLHALGSNVKVICYVDVGTWEDYRPDASSFPASVLGDNNGWPGEKWLDIRQQSILLPIMQARLEDWCLAKGFDAVEPDNLDGWQNKTGFPLTKAENLSYDLAIASMAHSLGLSVGLKNLAEQAPSLEPDFDWALDEQCFQYDECSYFEKSFIADGKAVFDVEYHQAPNCTSATASFLNAQRRDLNLHAPTAKAYLYEPCVVDTATTW